MKAIKAGEDPNATNPAPKEEEEAIVDQPDVQAFDESVAEQASKPRQASVEEVTDEADHIGRKLAHESSLDESLHPSRTSSVPRPSATSDAEPPEIPSVPQNAPGTPGKEMDIDFSSGGLELPSAPDAIGGSSSIPQLPDTPGSSNAQMPRPSQSDSFQSFPPPAASPSVPAPDPASFYSPSNASAHIPAPAAANAVPSIVPSPVAPPPVASNQPSHAIDDNAITQAQKHARWAVSAMTFDDVDTAIKELRNSLRFLGAE